MINPTVADELLVVAATVLLFLEIYALRMVRVLRAKVNGQGGDYLLKVVYRFGFFVVLGQSLTVLNAVLRLSDPVGTYDTRLMVLLVGEIMLATAFLWTVWEIHHLPADRYRKDATTRRSESPECICKEINNAISSAGAPVDQSHDDTPVSPV